MKRSVLLPAKCSIKPVLEKSRRAPRTPPCATGGPFAFFCRRKRTRGLRLRRGRGGFVGAGWLRGRRRGGGVVWFVVPVKRARLRGTEERGRGLDALLSVTT